MNTYATCPAAYPLSCAPASIFTTLVLSTINFGQHRQREVDVTSPPAGNEYDFVVVGGGSAGCVVASRLSENSRWKVLLLEAGPEEPLQTEVPAFNRFFIGSDVDWRFVTQPSGWDPGQIIPRGHVLGGSSSINGMLYSRGNPEDYDRWEKDLGNTGWSFRDVLPFFKKSERNNMEPLDKELHSRKGPLDVQHFPYRDENVPILLDAFQEIGLRFNPDHTGRTQIGSTLLQFTQRDGHRRSANRAFIFPVRRLRPNLVVQTLSPVRRVVINPRTKQAVAVEYDSPRGHRTVRVRKEVILSAGSLQSPQLLMRSGVGPRRHLQQAGIPTILDNPNVGSHLKDHLTAVHTVNFTLSKTATRRFDSLPQRLADLSRYQDGQHGPFSATGVRQVAAFFRTKHQRPKGMRPYIHLEIIGQLTDPERGSQCPNCTQPKEDTLWYNQFRFSPVFLHPRYTGQVRLNTSDPYAAKPLVYLNISLDRDERMTWVEGFKKAAELGGTEAFRRAGITLDMPPIAGCRVGVKAGSDEYWECAGRLSPQTWGHLIGSCRMGPNPSDSVVDTKLRVHGIKGLRIVDASVMPDLPSGNTNGPSIMVGERGADFIKRAHGQQSDETIDKPSS